MNGSKKSSSTVLTRTAKYVLVAGISGVLTAVLVVLSTGIKATPKTIVVLISTGAIASLLTMEWQEIEYLLVSRQDTKAKATEQNEQNRE